MDAGQSCPLSECIATNDMESFKRMLCEWKRNPVQLQPVYDGRGWTGLFLSKREILSDEYNFLRPSLGETRTFINVGFMIFSSAHFRIRR